MTRDQWKRIKDLAGGAMAEPASARAAFLAARCGSDAALRHEVESLLASTDRAESLFEPPAVLIDGAPAALEALGEFDAGRIGERIGPYRIVRRLGGGGMGDAYLAVRADEAFDKNVAIKLIKRGMDTDAVLRRFRQERQILADLDHPHIARLLDGGTTADGLPYVVMEYVEGLPLDAYCETHRLSTRERVALFVLVCDAVQHAHDRRVIHRDLKPSNILVTANGTPKLLDFGISKLLSPQPDARSTESTLLSRAMTPQYASPEQVRGGTVAVTTDVYSLGALLYELLARQRPYRLDGRTLQDITDIICHEPPAKPSAARRDLSGDLDNVVLMALRKEPERRYASVKALSQDLSRHLDGLPVHARASDRGYQATRFVWRHRARAIELALVTAVIAAVALVMPASRDSAALSGPEITAVAVLPFANDSGESTEYLSAGLTEGLIDGLSRLRGLKVSSRESVFGLKSAGDPRVVAQALGVGAVLRGRLTQRGNGVALGLELVDGADGRQLWQERYEGTLAGLPAMRERVTRSVSERLGRATPQRIASVGRQTRSADAYQLYLKGRYVWNKRTEDGFRQGLGYFQQALDKDPQYALAYTGLADCYNLLGVWGALAPSEAMPKVKDASLKALAIDDSLAEAHTSLAFVHWVYDWDWDAASREFQRALELDPDYTTALDWYAYFLASRKRFDEAIQHITRAQQIDPVSLSITTDVGEIHYWAGRYQPAVEQLRGVLQIEPDFPMARNILGLTYLKMGRTTDAVAELEAAERLASGPRMLSTLAFGYGMSGSARRARTTTETLERLSAGRYVSAFSLGVAYLGAGDPDRALAELERAFAEREDTMAVIAVYPLLDSLRGNPRFQDLLRRVGHP
jgi:TolB-like protein/Flp pilus assembly protein TadD/tRNA A-37 threonylcarbamoyl transferase component Bud32